MSGCPLYYLIAIPSVLPYDGGPRGGHYLAARRFGMRVTRFSIGFGPTLWKHKPKGSRPRSRSRSSLPRHADVAWNPYERSIRRIRELHERRLSVGASRRSRRSRILNYSQARPSSCSSASGSVAAPSSTRRCASPIRPEGPAALSGIPDGRPHPPRRQRLLTGLGSAEGGRGAAPGQPVDVEIERGASASTCIRPARLQGATQQGKDHGEPLLGVGSRLGGPGRSALSHEPPKVAQPGEGPRTIGGGREARALRSRRHRQGDGERGEARPLDYLGSARQPERVPRWLQPSRRIPLAPDGGRLLFLLSRPSRASKADAAVEAK